MRRLILIVVSTCVMSAAEAGKFDDFLERAKSSVTKKIHTVGRATSKKLNRLSRRFSSSTNLETVESQPNLLQPTQVSLTETMTMSSPNNLTSLSISNDSGIGSLEKVQSCTKGGGHTSKNFTGIMELPPHSDLTCSTPALGKGGRSSPIRFNSDSQVEASNEGSLQQLLTELTQSQNVVKQLQQEKLETERAHQEERNQLQARIKMLEQQAQPRTSLQTTESVAPPPPPLPTLAGAGAPPPPPPPPLMPEASHSFPPDTTSAGSNTFTAQLQAKIAKGLTKVTQDETKETRKLPNGQQENEHVNAITKAIKDKQSLQDPSSDPLDKFAHLENKGVTKLKEEKTPQTIQFVKLKSANARKSSADYQVSRESDEENVPTRFPLRQMNKNGPVRHSLSGEPDTPQLTDFQKKMQAQQAKWDSNSTN